MSRGKTLTTILLGALTTPGLSGCSNLGSKLTWYGKLGSSEIEVYDAKRSWEADAKKLVTKEGTIWWFIDKNEDRELDLIIREKPLPKKGEGEKQQYRRIFIYVDDPELDALERDILAKGFEHYHKMDERIVKSVDTEIGKAYK